jgi:hypothetical protein
VGLQHHHDASAVKAVKDVHAREQCSCDCSGNLLVVGTLFSLFMLQVFDTAAECQALSSGSGSTIITTQEP